MRHPSQHYVLCGRKSSFLALRLEDVIQVKFFSNTAHPFGTVVRHCENGRTDGSAVSNLLGGLEEFLLPVYFVCVT
jgi:hypothetical protein